MPFDIALSNLTDLIITGSRDLAGVSGDALVEQRIRTRLKIKRGSWVLDESGDFGSIIYKYMGSTTPRMVELLPDVIRTALLDMDDIVINDIEITDATGTRPADVTTAQVVALISYSHTPDQDALIGEGFENLGEQTVGVPITLTPEGGE